MRDLLVDYVYEHAPIILLVIDGDGLVVEANHYAQQILGGRLEGRSACKLFVDFAGTDLVSEAIRSGRGEQLLNISTVTGLPQSFRFSFHRADGRSVILGRIDGMEQERLRKEVVTLNNELGNLTRELHRKNAELARLNNLKNDFLGMAAHDLRKPLGLILGYTELLEQDLASELSEEHYGFLKQVLQSCERMRRLIDDFLDLSAIESGRLVLDAQPTYVDEVVERVEGLLRLYASRAQVELVVHAEPDLGEADIDGPKIEQVLINLGSNAIEYSPAGSQVRISVAKDAGSLRFAVRDQGPGIAPEQIETLFTSSQRVTSARKQHGRRGSGLGLLIARKIIEGHGGRIGVDSQVGEGSTFWFALPLAPATAKEASAG